MSKQDQVKKIIQNLDASVSEDQVERALLIARFTDESERGAVLVGVAYIDYALQKMLLNAMHKPSKSLFEGGSSPLGSFSTKIKLAHAFGLISDNMSRNLNILRKIRNSLAHEWDEVDLGASPYRDWIGNLGHLFFDEPIVIDDEKFRIDRMMSFIIYHLSSMSEEIVPVPCFSRHHIDFTDDEESEYKKWIEFVSDLQAGKAKFPRSWYGKQRK